MGCCPSCLLVDGFALPSLTATPRLIFLSLFLFFFFSPRFLDKPPFWGQDNKTCNIFKKDFYSVLFFYPCSPLLWRVMMEHPFPERSGGLGMP